jgi:hypothetical protein
MAGNPWFPSQTERRVLALSAYAYQRGVSLLLALMSFDPNAVNHLRSTWRTLPTSVLIAMVHVVESDKLVRGFRSRATTEQIDFP